MTVFGQQTWDFDYTGNSQSFTVPAGGKYLIEVWGASGGDGMAPGGKGGYSKGEIQLTQGETIYIYVGQEGQSESNRGSGGGATDLRMVSGDWHDSNSLNSRIIVAGGGGGGGRHENGAGGHGGGLVAGDGQFNNSAQGGQFGLGADQNSGGGYDTGDEGGQNCLGAMSGSFGYGGDARYVGRGNDCTNNDFYEGMDTWDYRATHGAFNGGGTYDNRGWESGGGGGGWYGGGAPGSGDFGGGGGGGSGYTGSLEDAELIAGNAQMPNPAGGTMTGNEGDGFARITQLYYAEVTETGSITCPGGSDGELKVQINGGIPPYSFEWSNGETSESGVAISGYDLLGHIDEHSYYRSVNTVANFSAAAQAADAQFGYMAAINSSEENDWLFNNGGAQGDFFGLSDSDQEGEFVWESGEPLTYTNWNTGEPNDSDNEDFGQFTTGGKWNDNGWGGEHVLLETPGESIISGLTAGTYSVTVTDGNGVQTTTEFVLEDPDSIQVSFDQTHVSNCSGIEDGALEVNPSGGTAPYTFEWGTGETTAQISDKGTGEYTVTITDANGCTEEATGEITVDDNTDPQAVAKDVTVYLDENGAAIIAAEDIDNGSSDDCAIESMEVIGGSVSCEDLDDNDLTATLRVTDAGGNIAEDIANVTVRDTIAPTVAAFDIAVALDQNGEAMANANVANNGSTDNCGIAGFDLSKTNFDCSDVGTSQIMFIATDHSGNSQSVPINIQVYDNMSPEVQVEDQTVYLDENGMASMDAATVGSGSSDNCGIEQLSLSKSSFSCEDIGQREVTLTVEDASGNQSQKSFNVEVVDNAAPSVQFVESPILYLDEEGVASVSEESLIASAEDNCQMANIEFGVEMFSCAEAGIQSISATASDAHGNSQVFGGQVNVVDTIQPVLAIESIELEIDEEGNAMLTPEMLMPYASDNCGIAEIVVEVEQFGCGVAAQGSSTDVIVYDNNGNVVQKNIDVQLTDAISPVVEVADIEITLNLDGTAVLSPEDLDIEYSDNCSVDQLKLDKTEFTCADLGPNAIEITARDAAGNVGGDEFIVNIIDDMAPSIQCPGTILMCEGVPDYSDIMVTDNCSALLEITDGPKEGKPLEAGEYLVELTATDEAGNNDVCMVTVEVYETPQVELGEDFEAELGSVVTVTAGPDDGTTYEWSNGEMGHEIEFFLMGDMELSVTATSPGGCASTDTVFIEATMTSGIEEAQAGGVNVYPNPAAGELNVSFELDKAQEDVRMDILDFRGRLVKTQQFQRVNNGTVLTVNLDDLADGTYIVTFRSEELNITERIVKQ